METTEDRKEMSPSLSSHRPLFLSLCSPLSSSLAPVYWPERAQPCLSWKEDGFQQHPPLFQATHVLTVQCWGRGGAVPSCSWEKTGQKGTDSGWKQSSLKSRALGREHRQWHLLSCQESLGTAKFLPTLLTPFMGMKPGLGS